MFTLINRQESSGDCGGELFLSGALEGDILMFAFRCRAEDWFQAEGLIRKRRRQRGELESAEDSEVEPLPKPEPMEDVIPNSEVLVGATEVMSAAGSPPQLRSPMPLSYADEPGVQHGEKAHPALRPIEGEEPQAPPSDSNTLERPRKIPRRSGNSNTSPIGAGPGQR